MNAALDQAVSVEAVRVAIQLAEDAHQLHYISRTKIPHLKGILDLEREALQQTVRERFSQLNLQVVKNTKPRWHGMREAA